MLIYLMLLVGSVCLGTELFALETPFLQITLYRVLSLGFVPLFLYKIYQKDPRLTFDRRNMATGVVGVYVFWLLWAFISGAWAWQFRQWFQSTFLIALGVFSILALYFWLRDTRSWQRVMQVFWLMQCLLILWGLYEILTNHYVFADLAKLDKHNIFASNPWNRIPITVFENQNDYATFLLAGFPVSFILAGLSQSFGKKVLYLLPSLLSVFLIFRSESRMILLSVLLFFVIYLAFQVRWDLRRQTLLKVGGIALIVLLALVVFLPPLRAKVASLVYIGGNLLLTGDVVRLNLWRNGLIFLAASLGLGVGAGNIEPWMRWTDLLPIKEITNMHNWWLEILVAYGMVVFILYVMAYCALLYKLWTSRYAVPARYRNVNHCFIAFLLVFIPASITSANNILIEWHWVFFGLLISYVNIMETALRQDLPEPVYFDKMEVSP